ncbi:hypothetical protein MIB92_18615 [Aestuariirhabdus sp. Z084]|uniref:hypothetical protein n=1 Tax=Aestuariirhabdus haliotis TaxID=2918751 RepID=UPI00201B35A6|nr:hypothetical protein [Aestuariirhabdus haliotis]MCL6417679.1 hypothetical protein [Aestuariirhabdus haliotis]MCL6421594.1 hypothetical protein [Aestuariirhabdus haliotis]
MFRSLIMFALSSLLSLSAYANDRTLVGSVIKVTGASEGIYFEMNAGVPTSCADSKQQGMLILADNIPSMLIISSSLMARFVTVTADYDSTQKRCIVDSVSME